MFSVLSHLFVTERHRARGARSGFVSVPAMMELEGPKGEADPVVVSTARGKFVQTRKTSEGLYRFAFFPCSLEEEGEVPAQLLKSLWAMSLGSNWSNRHRTVSEAIQVMKESPFKPKTVVLPRALAESFAGCTLPEGTQAFVVGGLNILIASLPEQSAIVATHPACLGVYARIGDHIGLQLYGVSQTLRLVYAGSEGLG